MFFPFLAASAIGISFIKLGSLSATNAFLSAGLNFAILLIIVLAVALLKSRKAKEQ